MGQFEVKQRTQDGYFNATELLRKWSESADKRKDINVFLRSKNTKELVNAIDSDTTIIVSKKGAFDVRKGGKNQGTWMQPYLFIDFAMWLNPKFKLQVIKFVHDQLIEFRHDAGDNYKELSSAVQQFKGINFPQMAKGLNWIVFNKHETGIRQKATKVELLKLNDVQKKLAFACDMGYIKSFDQLLEEMRKMYFSANELTKTL